MSWVFPNQTVEELATHLPRTRETLKQIHGMGNRRIDYFGDRIIDAIQTALDDD